MDNKLDEATVAAQAAMRRHYGTTTMQSKQAQDFDALRAGILAGMKVLLGEPVAWQRRICADGGHWSDWVEWEDPYGEGQRPKIGHWDAEYRPVYAPDLGGGK